jgi:hypothetical protein
MIVDLAMEKQRAKRQRPIRAHGTPGQVAGAATEYSPSSKLIVQNGLPNCVLPESPCPGHRTLTPVGPEQQLSSVSFMPRGASVSAGTWQTLAWPGVSDRVASLCRYDCAQGECHQRPLESAPSRAERQREPCTVSAAAFLRSSSLSSSPFFASENTEVVAHTMREERDEWLHISF